MNPLIQKAKQNMKEEKCTRCHSTQYPCKPEWGKAYKYHRYIAPF